MTVSCDTCGKLINPEQDCYYKLPTNNYCVTCSIPDDDTRICDICGWIKRPKK